MKFYEVDEPFRGDGKQLAVIKKDDRLTIYVYARKDAGRLLYEVVAISPAGKPRNDGSFSMRRVNPAAIVLESKDAQFPGRVANALNIVFDIFLSPALIFDAKLVAGKLFPPDDRDGDVPPMVSNGFAGKFVKGAKGNMEWEHD